MEITEDLKHFTAGFYDLFRRKYPPILQILPERFPPDIFHHQITVISLLRVIRHCRQKGMIQKTEKFRFSFSVQRKFLYRPVNAQFQISGKIHGTFPAFSDPADDTVTAF